MYITTLVSLYIKPVCTHTCTSISPPVYPDLIIEGAIKCRGWWNRLVTPLLGRQRQAHCFKVKASIVYKIPEQSAIRNESPHAKNEHVHIHKSTYVDMFVK